MSAPDANGWMLIETAPKDGSVFLIAEAGHPWAYAAWFDIADKDWPWKFLDDTSEVLTGCCDHERTERIATNAYPAHSPPTHWQPLPKPPVQP